MPYKISSYEPYYIQHEFIHIWYFIAILIKDKKLISYILKFQNYVDQILHKDKNGFLRPGHNYIATYCFINFVVHVAMV